MKVYFVRHGQSESNKRKEYQNPEDPLSPMGREQARVVAKRFKTIPIEIIMSSDLPRARVTAEEIAVVTGKKVIHDKLLREKLQPSLFWGKQLEEPEVLDIKKLMVEKSSDPNWHHSDEENYYDVEKRAKALLSLLTKREEKHIAVVSHGAFIKTIITYLFFGDKSSPDYFNRVYNFFWASNVGITVLEYRNPEIAPKNTEETRRWHLMTWNDHAHLGELK